MPMHKGEWHKRNGKMVRRRHKPYSRTVKRTLAVEKTVHNGEIVDDVIPSLSDIVPVRLEAILNALWQDFSLAQKVMAVSTHYFDPSNPGND